MSLDQSCLGFRRLPSAGRATSADSVRRLHGSPDYRLALEPPLAEIKIRIPSTTQHTATPRNGIDRRDMVRDVQSLWLPLPYNRQLPVLRTEAP